MTLYLLTEPHEMHDDDGIQIYIVI